MTDKSLFATAINCMDGRVQEPVIEHLKTKYGVVYVDMITTAGPDGILAQMNNYEAIKEIRRLADISVGRHGSIQIAIVGHYDCTGNPVNPALHHSHIQSAIQTLRAWYPNIDIVGLWINENWIVEEL